MNESLLKIEKDIRKMNQKGINTDFILKNLEVTVGQLKFFYCDLNKNNDVDYDKLIYHQKVEIKEHTLVYVNLGIGYPKEINGGHWCYVYKVLGYKAIVIPTHSIKAEKKLNKYDYEIKINHQGFKTTCLMNFSEMRCVDMQRFYSVKGIINVITPRYMIEEEMRKILDL